MKKMCFSIKIPFWKIIHFEAGKKAGESQLVAFKGLAHYDNRGRCLGKSIRNFVGELNHYDCRDRCIGYSRRSGFGEITHFNHRGRIKGKTASVLGILFLHAVRSLIPLYSSTALGFFLCAAPAFNKVFLAFQVQ